MMPDPYTTSYLAKTHIQEMQEEAEKARLLKEIATADTSLVEFIATIMSGWMQRLKPTHVEPKRSTAEIPSL